MVYTEIMEKIPTDTPKSDKKVRSLFALTEEKAKTKLSFNNLNIRNIFLKIFIFDAIICCAR